VKIAVLASREDARYLVPTLRVFRELGIPAYALSIRPDWIELDSAKVRSFLDEASHFILVADALSMASSWFGFAVGSAARILNGVSLLRVDPAWELPRYLRAYPVFEDLEELRAFFASKKTVWLAEEARQAARTSLLEQGVSVNLDSLAAAVVEGDIRTLRLFLDAGYEADLRDRHGVPLLCLAARNRHHGVAEVLIDRGANLDLQGDDRGYSALMDATLAGEADLVAFLLERGANPDLVSKDGQTALIIAVGRKDGEVVRLLLAKGADPDLSDKLGLSARGYARLFKQTDILELIEGRPRAGA
jgi:hypothetical protein